MADRLEAYSLYELETERQGELGYQSVLRATHADAGALEDSARRIEQLEAEILRRSHRRAHG